MFTLVLELELDVEEFLPREDGVSSVLFEARFV